ncbi:MAG: hydrolase [Bacteroidia bacterium]|nr:hydrolase [Bacteroidia bacterium]
MKKYILVTTTCLLLFVVSGSCKSKSGIENHTAPNLSLAEQNITRAIELLDNAASAHLIGNELAMARFYNPHTGARSEEKGSIWMYTAVIEAVNSVLRSLKTHHEMGDTAFHNQHFNKYTQLLKALYDNADYYLGTFELISYTQTAEWSVYGVHRAREKGKAKVEGIENVYDDQMWLVRELLHSYKLTGETDFLQKAEYLTEYVLDGWDCTFDAAGNEIGGIPWGPGYVSKHSCSNGPMVSPLVWLHEIYKEKDDEITHRYISSSDGRTRVTESMKKSEYYLLFAEKVYDWQKRHLLRSDGVYDDFLGGCTPRNPQTETIDGVVYRRGNLCRDRVGPPYTYNSGTDLYRVTNEKRYLEDAKKLSDASFSYFAEQGAEVSGYYTYDVSGFQNWFNGVLMRAYVEFQPYSEPVSDYIATFQQNLDYGYENYLYKGFLPTNLLTGWSNDMSKNDTEGMFSFTFAAEYALLAQYEMTKYAGNLQANL